MLRVRGRQRQGSTPSKEAGESEGEQEREEGKNVSECAADGQFLG